MTQTPIVHEFKELGTLQLESGKTIGLEGGTAVENYWMRANFEALSTGATYCAEIDDDQIRKYCTILNADPDLLNDFLVVKPSINILPQAVMAEFTLQLGSKTYGFIVHIPKFTPEGSLAEVVELHQKNNVLVRRIKTLEERIMKQEKNNIIMLTDLCMPHCFADHYADSYLQRCIEMTCEVPHRFDMMIYHIKTHTSKVGTLLLEMIKNGKLPKLRECIVNKNKEIYLALIGENMQCVNYVDRILCFCQLEIKMDNNVVYKGRCYYFPDGFDKPYQDKVVKYTMLEYFDHQVTNYIPGFHKDDTDYQIIIRSPEFSKKCNEIRTLLIKLNGK